MTVHYETSLHTPVTRHFEGALHDVPEDVRVNSGVGLRAMAPERGQWS